MNAAETLEIAREAVVVMLKMGAPLLIVGLVVGLAISLLQALTQMQEMTLSFVPKLLIMFVSLILFLPFMLSTLSGFTERLVHRIVAPG